MNALTSRVSKIIDDFACLNLIELKDVEVIKKNLSLFEKKDDIDLFEALQFMLLIKYYVYGIDIKEISDKKYLSIKYIVNLDKINNCDVRTCYNNEDVKIWDLSFE